MQKQFNLWFFIGLMLLTVNANAYQIVNHMLSPTGGSVAGSAYTISTSNMQPYGKYTLTDVQPILDQGFNLYNPAKDFLDSLSLINSADARIALIKSDPLADYGSVSPSLIADFAVQRDHLTAARLKFLYGALIGDQNSISYLNSCTQSIITAHIVFGDEYLIDALDYRVFSNIPDINGQLQKKYDKMTKAAEQYKLAVSSAVEAMTYDIGDSLHTVMGSYFDQGEFDLFNLACERFSMAMTDLASLEYLINMTPDPKYEWKTAQTAFKNVISQASVETYIQAAALSSLVPDFADRGIGLLHQFELLQKKGAMVINNLNILGYDNRFMPLADFSSNTNGSIYPIAQQAVQLAKESEASAKNDTRQYDSDKNQVQSEVDSMYLSYTSQLSGMTGVSSPIPAYPANDTYLESIANAGHDLLDCSIELESAAFDACMIGKTAGSLGSKYRQIKQADLKVELALQQRNQAKERIDMEQAQHELEIQLESAYFTDRVMTLRDFTEKLIDAQKTSRTKVQRNTKVYDTKSKKWKRVSKITESSRTIEFDARPMRIDLDKEITLLELERKNQITIKNANHADVIRKLYMDLANSLIEVNITVQEMNAVSADFFNLLTQKDNLLAAYLQAAKHLEYKDQNVLTSRIIKASSVLDARRDLEVAKHWTYLAAKTLEYKFLRPITNLNIAGKTVNMDDVFKSQTADDLDGFLLSLNGLNALWCGMGDIQI